MHINELNNAPLSNIYLYKNNKAKLIPYLENVFIKNIFCCNCSINILLHSGQDEYNMNRLIKLKNNKSYINISCCDNKCGYYLSKDLLLYEFYGDRNIKNNNICKDVKNNNYFNIYNIKPILKKDKENKNVWYYDILKINDSDNENMKKKEFKYKNINKYFYGNNIFFAINNINDIYMWKEKKEYNEKNIEKKKKFIYNPTDSSKSQYYQYNYIDNNNFYISGFVKYLYFPDKISIEFISCGNNHTLFLSKDKNCYGIGCNKFYQINYHKDRNKTKPFFDQPVIIYITNKKKKKKDIKYIAAGYSHNLICTYKNEIYSWGNNIYHQIFRNRQSVVKKPTLILNKRKIINIIKNKNNIIKNKNNIIKNKNNKIKNKNNIIKNKNNIIKNKNNKIKNKNNKIKNIYNNNNPFEVLKICCGFSFSCILLKNKKCFLIGKTYSNKKLIKKKIIINNNKSYHHNNNNYYYTNQMCEKKKSVSLIQICKNKKIDDIYCTFYDIVLVENLKLSNLFPTIIHPQKKNKKVYLFFNFKIKKSISYKIRLNNYCMKVIKNEKDKIQIKKKCKQIQTNILPTHKNDDNDNNDSDNHNKNNYYYNNNMQILFHFNYPPFNDKSNPLSLQQMFDVDSKKFKKIKTKHIFPYIINNNMINQKLYLTLYNNNNTYIHFYNKYLMLSSYKGIIKNIIPNNCALKKKIKIKLIINKVPIYINKKFISILFYFKGHGQKDNIQVNKGKMNKNKKSIYTNIILPTYNHNDNIFLNNTHHHFNICEIYFSLGYHFYKSSFPIIIIKPDILNISPSYVSINNNNSIYINMLHLSSNFHTIHVILYNTHLSCIYRKAYYDERTENYFFSLPLIPLTLFQKIKSEFIKFQVFASYNNVEYSQNDILLTVTKF
ncbi:conserved Plasmodium protein, unknown function [Plasmodium sp. gorilla clade G2]|uniref:conserved Plasmodium protein, unknown function n=1 Tax=Plasmodium sp. gorilla clade G2 TaxID=880535 RepID=UPI000D21197B|nr:conserved Plasmodium protein, unknown function [Plasmodium sp. gorilla clade G2]SOV16079.1 conserved Plasmodium protein, unknown function [Plasmodium sp. gorilla clade G2]